MVDSCQFWDSTADGVSTYACRYMYIHNIQNELRYYMCIPIQHHNMMSLHIPMILVCMYTYCVQCSTVYIKNIVF